MLNVSTGIWHLFVLVVVVVVRASESFEDIKERKIESQLRLRLRLRQSWKGKTENEKILQRSFNSKPSQNLEDFKMGNCIHSFMSERSRLSRVQCNYFVHIVQCDFDNFHSLVRVGKWIFHKKILEKEKLQVWIGCRYGQPTKSILKNETRKWIKFADTDTTTAILKNETRKWIKFNEAKTLKSSKNLEGLKMRKWENPKTEK